MSVQNVLEHRSSAPRQGCVCVDFHPLASVACEGCRASVMGRNCWEMAVSPCCNLSRDACETCTTYAAVMRSLALTERVRVELEGGLVVEGEMHCRPDLRLSDILNDTARAYITLTDATIRRPAGAEAPEHREIVLVAKAATLLITLE